MISFAPTEEQELVRETVRAFAREELRERARPADEAGAIPDGLLEKAWELGLVNGAIPESLGGGGLGRSPITSALVLEELGFGDVGLAVALAAPSLFANAVLDFGTEAQQRELLPQLCGSKPHAASVALHEPQPAFDASGLRTVAEPKGDGFRLSGAKRLVPLGDRASHFLVLARDARTGLDGVGAFVVPRGARGLAIAPEKTLGLRAAPFSRLSLEGVEVPAAARLGGERGIDARRLLASFRLGTAALALGLSRGVLELATPYARERVAFGEPIARKQAIAFMLAEMQIEVNAMRWMIWKGASLLEQGHADAPKAAQLAQTYVAREAMKIADNGLQIYGGHGYIREYPLEMWYRNARTLTVLETVAAL
jgi:alkylation response protein AidB-like acyl-CoA dehydrogenase